MQQPEVKIQPLCLTAEGDPKLDDSHVVEFGPRGVQFLVDALGLDIGVTTVEALLDNKALPRPLASVQREASGESEPQSIPSERDIGPWTNLNVYHVRVMTIASIDMPGNIIRVRDPWKRSAMVNNGTECTRGCTKNMQKHHANNKV